jgi:hypothetical protein
LGVLLQSCDLTFQPIWKADVVRIHSGNKFSPTQRDALIEPNREPSTGFFSDQPDTRVVETADDRTAFIRGAVVDHDQFPILQRLQLNRSDGGTDSGRAIQDRHDYGDERWPSF